MQKLPPWPDEKPVDVVQAMTEAEAKAYYEKRRDAMQILPREVPIALSEKNKQKIEVVAGAGGELTIDVAKFK